MPAYRNLPDQLLGLSLLLGQLTSALIVTANVSLCLLLYHFDPPFNTQLALLNPPFLLLLLSAFFLRRELFLGRYSRWAYLAALIGTLLSLTTAFIWFRGPMHEIGLIFDSHGRWGCSAFTTEGKPAYFFRDQTAPWILFFPLMLAITLHFLYRRKFNI